MYRRSLRVRLLALMILLTTGPVLILTWFAAQNTRDSVEAEIVRSTVTRVMWGAQYTEELLLQLNELFYSLQVDPDFAAALERAAHVQPGVRDVARRELRPILSAAYFANSRIVDELSVYIRATGEALTVNNVTSGRTGYPDLDGGIYDGLEERAVALSLRRADDGIHAVHTVNTFSDQELVAVLSARLEPAVEDSILSILSQGESDTVVVLNDDDEVLMGQPSMTIPDELLEWSRSIADYTAQPVSASGRTDLLFGQRIDRKRLTIVKSIPRSQISRSSRRTVAAGVLTGGLLVAASVLLSVLVSLRISRPIVELSRSMQESAVPDFERIGGPHRDEIRLLEDGYNALVRQVKELVQKEYEHEMELKDARLLALQAQINPHFLNNTLNLLGGMALVKGATDVYKLAQAVGEMFRYATGTETDLVTIEQEVEHARNYLLIQQHRFAGRCKVRVDLDPRILSTPVPRFTLQPLLENAFEHGLQSKTGEWLVSMRGRRQNRGDMIVITDNGVGMPRARLVEVRSSLADVDRMRGGSRHIGLRNVNSRLRLHFGNRFGLRLFSRPSEGTRVVLIVPTPPATGHDPDRSTT